jgi:hypothetical protein
MEPSSVVEIAASDSYGMLKDHNDIEYFHTNRGICDQGTGTVSIRSSCKMLDVAEIQFANEHSHLFSANASIPMAMNMRVAMATVRVATAEIAARGDVSHINLSRRSCLHRSWCLRPHHQALHLRGELHRGRLQPQDL